MVGGANVNRQDRGGVRTAQELERKYNLAGMKKAVKMQEEGINKTNATLESFINTTLRNAENMQAQTDGQVTTWFSHGEPTLASEPTVYWTTDEQKTAHTGDLYYDRDTGHAYIFELVDGEYKWSIVTDEATIEALAIANSSYDTDDNKRRVFIEQPYPPYENGDLWFTDGEIYICQVSKTALDSETGEIRVYEEGDFIVAVKYTDNTLASKVGGELKVLEGTVLTVIESANEFKAEVYNKDEKTQAAIDLINESLKTLIKGANGQSLMTQTENGWEFSIESLLNTVDKAIDDISKLEGDADNVRNDLENIKNDLNTASKVLSYVKVYDVDGDPHLELGTSANGFKSIHTNKGIQFMIGEIVSAFIDYNALNITRAIIHDELQIGGFLIKERANGNVGFVWRGDDN
jgi:phage-related protein